jgi:DNA gyrase inhibitor GyrI
MMAAILFKTAALSATVVCFHVLKASHAAFTASSTSSFVAWAHSANTLPSAGQIVLNVSWAEASFH